MEAASQRATPQGNAPVPVEMPSVEPEAGESEVAEEDASVHEES